jgi:hypothetical protein
MPGGLDPLLEPVKQILEPSPEPRPGRALHEGPGETRQKTNPQSGRRGDHITHKRPIIQVLRGHPSGSLCIRLVGSPLNRCISPPAANACPPA